MAAPSNPINALELGDTTPGTSWTVDAAYVVGSESNRVMILWVETEDGTTTTPTAVTFNSESFTLILDVIQGANRGSLWGLVNPTETTGAVVITFDSDPAGTSAIWWYHSDAEQVVPSEGEDSNSNAGSSETSIAVDCVTSGVDRMIVAGGGHGDTATMSAGTDETLIHEITGGSQTAAASYFVQATAGTRNMDFTFSAARRPNIVAVAIRPVAAAAGNPYYYYAQQ